MDVVVRVEPGVLVSLRKLPGVRPSLSALIPGSHTLGPPRARDSQAERALENLRQWTERWHLSEDWCIDWAIKTLRAEQLAATSESQAPPSPIDQVQQPFEAASPPNTPSSSLAGKRKVRVNRLVDFTIESVKLVSGVPFSVAPFRPDFGAWEWRGVSRRAFEEHARQRFREDLEAYCDRVELQIRASGFVPTPEKRSEDHFFWLARYQVKGERFADIARNGFALTPKQVEMAIRRIARFVGLKLRTSESS